MNAESPEITPGHEPPAAPVGFDQAMGFELVEATPDRVVMALEIGVQNLQPYRIVHGGTYCGLVESAASWGAALWLRTREPAAQVVGVANHTDFLRATRHGRITGTATPIHRGRGQQLWLVEVRDEQHRLVARGEVRLQNLAPDAV